MALTIKAVAKLRQKAGRHFDRDGLYLQVPTPGEKRPRQSRASWLLRYQLNGRERFMGLGAIADYDLDEAREEAKRWRRLAREGIDPLEYRRAERRKRAEEQRKAASIPTFEEAAERYYHVHGGKWRSLKHAKMFLATLKAHAFPKLGGLRVDEITTDDVRAAFEPIWHQIPDTANRTRGRVENVLSWAIANKYREGPNPAAWTNNLEHLLPAPQQIKQQHANHHAALPYGELPAFWAELDQREGVAARALAFAVLTAARTGEVIGARWSEIDLQAKTWTVPANRIKGGREHRVPLPDATIALLQALPTETRNDHVFVGQHKGAGLGQVALGDVLRRMGRKDITVHGFRSTFRDWAAERTTFPNHVVEMALAHAIPNAVEAAYRRGDLFEKRRKLMTAWAKFCTKPAAASEVVPLRRA